MKKKKIENEFYRLYDKVFPNGNGFSWGTSKQFFKRNIKWLKEVLEEKK